MDFLVFSYPCELFDGNQYKEMSHCQDHIEGQGVPSNEFYGGLARLLSRPCHSLHRIFDKYNYPFRDILCAIQYIRDLYNEPVFLLNDHPSTYDAQNQTHEVSFFHHLLQKHQSLFVLASSQSKSLFIILKPSSSFFLNTACRGLSPPLSPLQTSFSTLRLC